jgi:predicted metal-binding membrane protein
VPAHGLLVAIAGLRDATPRLAALLPALGGVMLIACGLYQLTPLKDACLNHCRVPHLFLGHHWRDGLGGAFVLGAHHGLYCAGCCASLMVVLMVVGLMNMVWMVGLSIVIYLEKIVPRGSSWSVQPASRSARRGSSDSWRDHERRTAHGNQE